MRWLYVPNENTEGDQIGPRMAFEKLQQEGFFSAYAVYSYLVRGTAVNCHQEALNEFIESARAFAPDVIFIQHPSNGYPMDRAWLRQLKSLPASRSWCYLKQMPMVMSSKKWMRLSVQ